MNAGPTSNTSSYGLACIASTTSTTKNDLKVHVSSAGDWNVRVEAKSR